MRRLGAGVPPTRWDGIADGSIRIPLNDKLGITALPAPDPQEKVTFSWTVAAEFCNAEGNLQGGMLAAFADAALGGASAAHLPPDQYPALAEMKVSILYPAPAGMELTATGYVLKKGRRVMFVESEVRDASGRLIAKATGTSLPVNTS